MAVFSGWHLYCYDNARHENKSLAHKTSFTISIKATLHFTWVVINNFRGRYMHLHIHTSFADKKTYFKKQDLEVCLTNDQRVLHLIKSKSQLSLFPHYEVTT